MKYWPCKTHDRSRNPNTICFTICLFISPDLDGYRAYIDPARPRKYEATALHVHPNIGYPNSTTNFPPTHRPTNQPTDRPTDQPTNQPTNQPTTGTGHHTRYDTLALHARDLDSFGLSVCPIFHRLVLDRPRF